jgi:hypothetical protein
VIQYVRKAEYQTRAPPPVTVTASNGLISRSLQSALGRDPTLSATVRVLLGPVPSVKYVCLLFTFSLFMVCFLVYTRFDASSGGVNQYKQFTASTWRFTGDVINYNEQSIDIYILYSPKCESCLRHQNITRERELTSGVTASRGAAPTWLHAAGRTARRLNTMQNWRPEKHTEEMPSRHQAPSAPWIKKKPSHS